MASADNFPEPACPYHGGAESMRVFDELPMAARRAFQQALDNWCCACVVVGLKSPRYAGLRVQSWDRGESLHRQIDQMRGTGPYTGNKPVPMRML